MTNYETISPEYVALNKQLHSSPQGFGGSGHKNADAILLLIEKYGLKSILDYGAGQGTLKTFVDTFRTDAVITNYDPACEAYSEKPRHQFDLVVCTDVLEHIEPEYLANVLAELWEYSSRFVYLLVCCVPANKTLPDGRNAHLIQQSPEWWYEQIMGNRPWNVLEYLRVPEKGNPEIVKKVIFLLEKPE